ncbi:MAG: hypothetical protein IT177_06760 [Acidobacteria bacterium]|nr:hypothetical protein [Acidobacteriota bacterium]
MSFPVVAILIAASMGCGSRVSAPTVSGGEPDSPASQATPVQATLRVGETHEVAGGKGRVTFTGVAADSRCPKGVTCVWEGDAAVDLRIQSGSAAAVTLQLHTNDRFDREAMAGGLRLRLESLDPYPDADRPIAAGDYRVVLSISTQ